MERTEGTISLRRVGEESGPVKVSVTTLQVEINKDAWKSTSAWAKRRGSTLLANKKIILLVAVSLILFSAIAATLIIKQRVKHNLAMQKIAAFKQLAEEGGIAASLFQMRSKDAPMSIYEELSNIIKSPYRTHSDDVRFFELSISLERFLNSKEMEIIYKGKLTEGILNKLQNEQGKFAEELNKYVNKIKDATGAMQRLENDRDITEDAVAKAEFDHTVIKYYKVLKESQ